MRQVVFIEIAARKDAIDKGKTCGGSVAHRHRHRAVQLDDGRRLDAEQDVVESGDLAPVRGVGIDRAGMHRRNR